MKIVLVGCVSQKLDHPAPARDLYTSQLFRLRRAYAEQFADEWFILSALHFLVEPDRVIEPYNRRLPQKYQDRLMWATVCRNDLGIHYSPLLDGNSQAFKHEYEIHAGEDYCDPFATLLEDQGARVHLPLKGLGIGQQLKWYKERLGGQVFIDETDLEAAS